MSVDVDTNIPSETDSQSRAINLRRAQRALTLATVVSYRHVPRDEFMAYAKSVVEVVFDRTLSRLPIDELAYAYDGIKRNFDGVIEVYSHFHNCQCNSFADFESGIQKVAAWYVREMKRQKRKETRERLNHDNTQSRSSKVPDFFNPVRRSGYQLPPEAKEVLNSLQDVLRRYGFSEDRGDLQHIIAYKTALHESIAMRDGMQGDSCYYCILHEHDETMSGARHSWVNCPRRKNMPVNLEVGQAFVEGTLSFYYEHGKRAADAEPGRKKKFRHKKSKKNTNDEP
ncbi:hypothetical protein CJU90_5958 [Yarrowia sp. C11]|nr:hypothetical protein CJU90_5958 [Yarrowia sp. C11]